MSDLQDLARLSKLVAKGEAAFEERRALVMRLWEGGMTQRELAERMSKASLAVGGPPVTENSVYKMIRRKKDVA